MLRCVTKNCGTFVPPGITPLQSHSCTPCADWKQRQPIFKGHPERRPKTFTGNLAMFKNPHCVSKSFLFIYKFQFDWIHFN